MATDLDSQLLEITEVFAQGDVDGAFARMAELELSCRTDAERSRVLARYATFFHLLELRDEELSALAQALLLDPTNPRAHYLNAIHLMTDDRWDDAIQALNTAAKYYPANDHVHLAEVYGNLSYCWEQLKDPARAEMYREISEELDPTGTPGVAGEEGAVWPEDLEPEEFEIPSDEELALLDAYDADDEDEQVTSASRLEQMLKEMGVKGGRAEKAREQGRPGPGKSARGGKPAQGEPGRGKSGGGKPAREKNSQEKPRPVKVPPGSRGPRR